MFSQRDEAARMQEHLLTSNTDHHLSSRATDKPGFYSLRTFFLFLFLLLKKEEEEAAWFETLQEFEAQKFVIFSFFFFLQRSPSFSPSREELLLQLKDWGSHWGALDAAQRHSAVPLLALRVHVQEGAAHLRRQHHLQVLCRPLARVVAQRVALVAASQQRPGVGLRPEGDGSRPGEALAVGGRLPLQWSSVLLLLLPLPSWRRQSRWAVSWRQRWGGCFQYKLIYIYNIYYRIHNII